MKTQLSNVFAPSGSQTKQLVNEAKEVSVQPAQQKNFSAAELWNIQRRHRTISQRRRFA
jgi:hypothetical protein